MEGTIPVAVLEQIKDATVFVKMDAGTASGSGSGFLMRVEGNDAYFVTNDHVVSPPTQVVTIGRIRPRVIGTKTVKARISVVLRSGTTREQVLPADVVTTDPEADLAVLRVTGARELPRPIDFSQAVQLVETMPLYIFGFPFGSALATNKGNPAITVCKGSVSSLRRDDRGELSVVQINGDLNPGNSGGPVVDAQGRLIGISVAAIKGTQIGLAIPTADLTQLLQGRALGTILVRKQMAGDHADVAGEFWLLDRNHKIRATRALNLRVNNVGAGGNDNDVEVEAKLLDPLRRITSVSLLYLRTDSAPPAAPNAQGRWDPLPGAQQLPLKIEEQKAVGGFNLPPGSQPQDQFAFQLVLVNGAGQTIYCQPRAVRLNFKAAVAQGQPAPPQPPPLQGEQPFAGGGGGGGVGVGQYGPDLTVQIKITNIADANTRQYILDRLPALTGSKNHRMQSRSSGKTTTVLLAPVKDAQAFAQKINFGKVTSVNGRVITVAAGKVNVPGAGADLVTKLLFDLRSPNLFTRKAALEKLVLAEPNDRREEVIKAIAPLTKDNDVFTRKAALAALGAWATKDTIPTIAESLKHNDPFTRQAAIEALAKLKDEGQAADLIAERLADGLDRQTASKSLQAMGKTAEKSAAKALQHPDWMVRSEACNVLKVVGTRESLSALQNSAKGDSNAIVRRAAAEAAQLAATRK
jgi:hypothetical protein